MVDHKEVGGSLIRAPWESLQRSVIRTKTGLDGVLRLSLLPAC